MGDHYLMPVSYIEFIPNSADRTIAVTSWIRNLAAGHLSSLPGGKALNVFGSGQTLTSCRRKKPRQGGFTRTAMQRLFGLLKLAPVRASLDVARKCIGGHDKRIIKRVDVSTSRRSFCVTD
jgi:hypothetical protein